MKLRLYGVPKDEWSSELLALVNGQSDAEKIEIVKQNPRPSSAASADPYVLALLTPSAILLAAMINAFATISSSRIKSTPSNKSNQKLKSDYKSILLVGAKGRIELSFQEAVTITSSDLEKYAEKIGTILEIHYG